MLESTLAGELGCSGEASGALKVCETILIPKNRTLCSLAYLQNRFAWDNLPKEKGLAPFLPGKGLYRIWPGAPR
jgi:hypothetical protein